MTRGLKTTAGATPDATVNAQISASIKHDGSDSRSCVSPRAHLPLRPKAGIAQPPADEPEVEISDDVIRALDSTGSESTLFGGGSPGCLVAAVAAKSVDFSGQRGVYVLSDHHTVIYVGRAVERDLGQRLYEHTLDRLSGRWNRFSGSDFTASPTLAS